MTDQAQVLRDVVMLARTLNRPAIELLELGHQHFGGDVDLTRDERRDLLPLLRLLHSYNLNDNYFDAIGDLLDFANRDNIIHACDDLRAGKIDYAEWLDRLAHTNVEDLDHRDGCECGSCDDFYSKEH